MHFSFLPREQMHGCSVSTEVSAETEVRAGQSSQIIFGTDCCAEVADFWDQPQDG